jgi:fatty-acyl-CoA synthase
MKYGFMTFSFPRANMLSLVDAALQAGYDGLELRISSNHGHGLDLDTSKEARTQALKTAKEGNIELYSIATSFKLALGPLDEAEASATIELANDLESRVIRVFGGAYQDDQISFEDARANLVAGLKRFGELSARMSKDQPVVIALESHDAWTDPAILAEVLDEVNMPHVGLNWDPYHIVRMTDQGVADHFPSIAKHVKHCHVHDGQASSGAPILCPIGSGIVDHTEMLEALASISYDGYLMGEWIHSIMEGSTDPIQYLPRELQALKKIEAELA